MEIQLYSLDSSFFSLALTIFLIFILYKFLRVFLINRFYSKNVQKVLLERQESIQKFLNLYGDKVPYEKQNRILSLTACELLNEIKQKSITSEEILITYSVRAATIGLDYGLIGDVNFEEALMEAKKKDEETNNTSELPPLHGLPISIKDHITTKGFRYTAGFTKTATQPKSPQDCNFIKVLRENGAIFYVTSNLPQGIGSIESYNKMWGRSLNPWDKSRTPGGSSGGEAGLVASKCSPLGIGSDAAGSIRIPCSFCGIYGFAPTGKRISLKKTLNLRVWDVNVAREICCSYGPMGKSIDDLLLITKCLFGKFTELDPEIAPLEWNEAKYQFALQKKKRIGVIFDDPFCESFPAIKNVIYEVCEVLKKKGHEIVPINENWTEEFMTIGLPVMQSHGMASNVLKTLEGETPEAFYRLQVLLSFLPNFVIKFFGFMAKFVGEARFGKILGVLLDRDLDSFYQCVFKKEILKDKFTEFWNEKKIDALISPILPFPAIKHGDAELLQGLIGSTFIYNIMGMPAGVVPIRNIREDEEYYTTKYRDMAARKLKSIVNGTKGLPVGVQVAAWSFNDEGCLAVMKEIEKEFQYYEYPNI